MIRLSCGIDKRNWSAVSVSFPWLRVSLPICPLLFGSRRRPRTGMIFGAGALAVAHAHGHGHGRVAADAEGSPEAHGETGSTQDKRNRENWATAGKSRRRERRVALSATLRLSYDSCRIAR